MGALAQAFADRVAVRPERIDNYKAIICGFQAFPIAIKRRPTSRRQFCHQTLDLRQNAASVTTMGASLGHPDAHGRRLCQNPRPAPGIGAQPQFSIIETFSAMELWSRRDELLRSMAGAMPRVCDSLLLPFERLAGYCEYGSLQCPEHAVS